MNNVTHKPKLNRPINAGNKAFRLGDLESAIHFYKAAEQAMPELAKIIAPNLNLALALHKKNKKIQSDEMAAKVGLDSSHKKLQIGFGHDFDVIFAIGCWEGESKRYRVHNIAEGLLEKGYKVDVIPYDDVGTLVDKCVTAHTVVLFRAAFDERSRVELFLKYAKRVGIQVIFDVDDLIFEPNVIDQIDGFRYLPAEERENYITSLHAYRKLMMACDRVVVPTEYLRQCVLKLGLPTSVVPNSINNAQMAAADSLKRVPKNSDRYIRIGYFSGSQTHQADFAECEEVLLALMSEQKNIILRVVGFLDISEKWLPVLSRVEQIEFQPYLKMLTVLSECDINIAPLQLSSVFCHGKSELKFFEAGLLGIPTVASATDTYSRAIENGVNGFCVRNSEEWREVLSNLINSEELRNKIGQEAKKTAGKRYAVTQVAADAAQIYGLRQISDVDTDPFKPPINKYDVMSIAWVIPGLIIGGGGHRNILRAAYYLSQFGHDISLYFIDTTDTAECLKQKIKEHFYPLECHVEVFSGHVKPVDVIFATHWSTVSAALAGKSTAKEVMYFVQDFEPAFAPMSTEYVLAENTYRMGLYHITSGPWCEVILRRDFHAIADHFRFPVDRTIYYPRERTKKNKNIVFFAKPEMPRRCFELGIMALRVLHHHLPNVEILMFGSRNLRTQSFDFPVTICDLLPTLDDLAEMYSNGDVGLVFSTTNPSLIPYEMMACGLPIVDLMRSDNAENYGGRLDIALLAEPRPEHMAKQIVNLISNRSELTSRRDKGLDFIEGFPTESEMAKRVEFLIKNRMANMGHDLTRSKPLTNSHIICPICTHSIDFNNKGPSYIECGYCSSIVNVKDLKNIKNRDIIALQVESSKSFYKVGHLTTDYIESEVSKRYDTMKFLFEKFPELNPKTFVDFGAGLGYWALAAMQYFEVVHAVEVNMETIESVYSQVPSSQSIGLHRSIDDIEVKIDCVFMWHVVEHLPNAHDKFRHIFNKLSTNGCIFAQVPMYKKEYENETHYSFLNRKSIEIMCQSVGFSRVHNFEDNKNCFLTFIAIK